MDEEFVVIYEFQIPFEQFKEIASTSEKEKLEPTMGEITNTLFSINTLLTDNGIYNYNEYEVASPNSVIGITVSDKSPNTLITVRVYVKKPYEEAALEIINSQVEFDEPEELKEPKFGEDDYWMGNNSIEEGYKKEEG